MFVFVTIVRMSRFFVLMLVFMLILVMAAHSVSTSFPLYYYNFIIANTYTPQISLYIINNSLIYQLTNLKLRRTSLYYINKIISL